MEQLEKDQAKKTCIALKDLKLEKITLLTGVATNLNFCKKILRHNVNEIYYLAGDSSVIKSFETPDISLKSNTEGILNILQTLKQKKI